MENLLIKKAKKARKYAYAPYSNFKVGAAISTKSGNIYTGCNVENASLGLTICAERAAMVNALSEGDSDFEHLVIVSDELTYPCGACRQFLREFVEDIEITLVSIEGESLKTTLKELLPFPFSMKEK